ncbi:hypothetical protein [Prevotella sp. MA2016]|uniref:hypothetical protein n=1 Tax=Prevotella sp. MA2016 TaxID=1408310 RepID=UPI000B13F819|nr:hypothetical protein [Prevotella sp. MA2016]
MKKIVLAVIAAVTVNLTYAQSAAQRGSQWRKDNGVFQNLDVSLTVGTTGIGIDVASRVHENVQLRMGYEYMPRFKAGIYFPVEVGGEPAVAYDEQGNRVETRFDRLSKMLTELTGFKVEDEVKMVGKPTVNNFKFLVDVFPFKNKHWHITGGFYWGASQFAYAENSTQAMTSLLAVSMYNQIYEKCVADEPIISIEGDGTAQNPGMNVFLTEAYRQKIVNYGRMGFHVGDNKDSGEPYIMEPDAESGMVKVRAKSNSFKPYLGFGYGGKLMKSRDDWKVSFDAGMMFWGGTPHLYTHDGTDLTHDVENITGKVGDWADFLGGIKVYPVLQVRFTKSIF